MGAGMMGAGMMGAAVWGGAGAMLAAAGLVWLLAGCATGPARTVASSGAASDGPSSPNGSSSASASADGARGLVDEGYAGRYRARATVLAEGNGDPALCLGAVRQSLPPQCGGPAINGWSWDAVPHESAPDVRWGQYLVTGTFDGTTFTLTEPASVLDRSDPGIAPDQETAPDQEADRFATPCPAPAGGWAPVEEARATQEAMGRADAVARARPGFAALWIDQNVPAGTPPEGMNDPLRLVLNVSTTQDEAGMERAVREVWGGALCVSRAPRTEAELLALQRQVEPVGMLSSSPDPFDGVLDVQVVRATVQQQAELDRRFGAGAVRLSGALRPIDAVSGS